LQVSKSIPAYTEGAVVKLIKTLSFAMAQLPIFVEVKIKFTNPALISEALGVYVAVKTVLLGLKVPEPPVQIPVVVAPDTVPERTVDGLFLHELTFRPAFTTGEFV
jgi:hypothetical protein